MDRETVIERVRNMMIEALRVSAAYTEKADQQRGYSRADKSRFRYLALESAKDAAALRAMMIMAGVA